MDLADDEGRGVPTPLDEEAARRVVEEWGTAKRCALVLDFDGTLVELQDDPEAVVPPRFVLDALEALAREDGTHVWIVSGRDSAFLSRTFRSIPVGLVAEHGAVISWPDKAVHRNAAGDRELEGWIEAPRDDWYDLARERMEAVTRSVAGSFVEQKSTGLCWHHRKAEPEVGLDEHEEDFGQTLATWGVDEGSYLYLPFFGPNTVRDVTDKGPSTLLNPFFYVTSTVLLPISALDLVNKRANLLEATNIVDEAAIDPYVFTKEAYLQRRDHLIFDGNPPVSGYDDIFSEADDESGVLVIE